MLDIRPHDDNFIKEENARHLWHPMAHPADSLANPPTIVTRGEGVYITDVDGHRVVDAVGGLWNVNLGFSCDPVKQAITDQLDRLPYYSIFRGTTNDVAVELSHELAQFFAPDGLQRAQGCARAPALTKGQEAGHTKVWHRPFFARAPRTVTTSFAFATRPAARRAAVPI